jgi:hypothetical protein
MPCLSVLNTLRDEFQFQPFNNQALVFQHTDLLNAQLHCWRLRTHVQHTPTMTIQVNEAV